MKASIQVLGDNGYVWDANVAHWLRLECGLMGAMVGGIAAFKQQNAVHGLPLELSPEEVCLALERGWGELAPPLATDQLAAALAAAGSGNKRGRDAYHYYSEGEEADGEAEAGADEVEDSAQQAAEPAWRAALLGGSTFIIPTTLGDTAAANGITAAAGVSAGVDAAGNGQQAAGAAAAGSAVAGGGKAAVHWSFPSTCEERHRFWVFRDLQAKGYRLTGGSKFGADYLVYPGDPTLYHAQFCVRLMPFGQPVLPAMLASATRGSHQARKHLLIASVVEGEEQQEQEEAETEAEAGEATRQQQQQQGAPSAADVAAGGALDAGPQQSAQAAGGQPPTQQGYFNGQQAEAAGLQSTISCGIGSQGERFRIHYLTIGPVEGFG